MRLNYTEEEDFSGQFELWQANCRRSLRGKLGQRELGELRQALLDLPDKRLIHGSLVQFLTETPEQRYEEMLAWVESKLLPVGGA